MNFNLLLESVLRLPKSGYIRHVLSGKMELVGKYEIKNSKGTTIAIGVVSEINYSYYGTRPIVMVYVNPKYRKQGLATKIMPHLIKVLRSKYEELDDQDSSRVDKTVFGGSEFFRSFIENEGWNYMNETFALPDDEGWV